MPAREGAPAHLAPWLVGRSEELRQLREALATVTDGRGKGASRLLVAPAGMGKSRLLETFFIELKISGVRLAHAIGGERAFAHPYAALGEAIGVLSETLRAQDAALLEAAGAPDGLLAALACVAGVPRSGDPMVSQVRRLRALRGLLTAVARDRPVVLLLDDAHRIDEESREGLLDLLASSASSRLRGTAPSGSSAGSTYRPACLLMCPDSRSERTICTAK